LLKNHLMLEHFSQEEWSSRRNTKTRGSLVGSEFSDQLTRLPRSLQPNQRGILMFYFEQQSQILESRHGNTSLSWWVFHIPVQYLNICRRIAMHDRLAVSTKESRVRHCINLSGLAPRQLPLERLSLPDMHWKRYF
jgi:hypothetical protein